MPDPLHLMTDDPLYREALERFRQLFERAQQCGLREPSAVTLATVDSDLRPAARVVLLRNFDQRGFVFYTNSESAKGRQLAENPQAALCFYWDPLREQVRIEGAVEPVSADESDAYWKTRPRDSQISAWASPQSQPLENRQSLEDRFAEFERTFAGRDVPRPEYWHGYRVIPQRIEFWQSRPARLHDRVLYEQQPDGWTVRLLYP